MSVTRTSPRTIIETGASAAEWSLAQYHSLYSGAPAVYEDPFVAAWHARLQSAAGTSASHSWIPLVRADDCGEHDLVEHVGGVLSTVIEVKSWFRGAADGASPWWDVDLKKLRGCSTKRALFALWVLHWGGGWQDRRDKKWRQDLESWARSRRLTPLSGSLPVHAAGPRWHTSVWIWTIRDDLQGHSARVRRAAPAGTRG